MTYAVPGPYWSIVNQNRKILGLRVAGTVFGLMSLVQLGRLVIRPEVLVAGHVMPLWPSMLALLLLGGLGIWLWSLSCRRD